MKKESVQQSAGKLIMMVFHHHQAYDSNTAIALTQLSKVPLSSDMIAYTVANFVQEGVLVVTPDDKYYFDQAVWKKLQRQVNRIYWVMLLAPVIIMILFLLLFNQGQLWASLFGK